MTTIPRSSPERLSARLRHAPPRSVFPCSSIKSKKKKTGVKRRSSIASSVRRGLTRKQWQDQRLSRAFDVQHGHDGVEAHDALLESFLLPTVDHSNQAAVGVDDEIVPLPVRRWSLVALTRGPEAETDCKSTLTTQLEAKRQRITLLRSFLGQLDFGSAEHSVAAGEIKRHQHVS